MSSSRDDRTAVRRRRPRSVRLAAAASTGTALVLAAAVLWHAAYAGFGDVTSALRSTVSTSTLALVDDDSATVMFTAAGLKPGMSDSKCIAVSSSGSPATVRLYGTGRSTTYTLASYLSLSVAVGTGGSTRNCNGFAPTSTTASYDGTLAAFPTDWSSGVGGWTTTGTAPTTRTYKITYTLPSTTPNNTQNGTAALGFVWEARTT
jgi:hypothetical protein